MNLEFEKWHGSGNDFIMVDARNDEIQLSVETIQRLCSRHTGIGSDGLIFIRPGHGGAAYVMDFYNPDGSQSFCGNGSRCAYAYYAKLSGSTEKVSFTAIDGDHEAWMDTKGQVSISMRPSKGPERISDTVDLLDTGSPHLIVWVDDPSSVDIIPEASKWRWSERFHTDGVNVNFVAAEGQGIRMRTYERGVENETLSCGTGVTAAALSAMWREVCESPCPVITSGGSLVVNVEALRPDGADHIILSGPVKFVFSGTVDP